MRPSAVQNLKTIAILQFLLCGCETWSLTLTEDNRLKVFKNRVLRGIFGPKRDEVTARWQNCTTKYFITYDGDEMKWGEGGVRLAGHIACM
jgi:hypothetical protein